MTLKNLLGISLEAIAPDRAQIQKMLAAAQRNIDDAQIKELSPENRFDAAYKAIMQAAMVALNANGYRTLTSKPGHHQTALQALPQTAGLAQSKVIVLDALRKQRNLADYSGDLVSDAAVAECLASAKELLAHVRAWLAKNGPDLA
ncbi:MAG: DNA-binding protein [Haliea sp.]|nr:MAG: DNA-binding protein [Haliea sp.]